MAKLCCISVTLAARLIGIFDLSASILAINFIAAEFFGDEKRLSAFNGIEICMELIWPNALTYSRLGFNRKWILICMMVYSILHFICSVGLVLATLTRKKAFTAPWLTFELISLANLASAVALKVCQKLQCICSHETISDAAYDLPVASLYLLLGAYFWLVVFSASKSWPTGSSDVFLESNESAELQWHRIDSNSPKKPASVTADDYSSFESPEAPIPSKYYQL